MIKQKWYMVTTVGGKEQQVIETLKNRITFEKMNELFADFRIMEIPYLSPREAKKKLEGKDYVVRQKNLFPGYIFVKMEMTNETWFLVRNTQFVTGLVGSSGSRTMPTPISFAEFSKIEQKVAKIKDDFEKGKIQSPFEPGIIVEVINGPTKGQTGQVIETDDKKHTSIVELIMFGRKTPVEISHKDLKIKK